MSKCKCKGITDKPLVNFRGKWFCPRCRKNMFPGYDVCLEISQKSQSSLIMAQRFFYGDYLTGKDAYGNELTGAGMAERKRRLAKAIDLCVESARSNNPYGFLMLGDFYRMGYADESLSGDDKLIAAASYYDIVFSNKRWSDPSVNDQITLKDISKESDFDKDGVRIFAAINLYKILSNSNISGINANFNAVKEYLSSRTPEQSDKYGIAEILASTSKPDVNAVGGHDLEKVINETVNNIINSDRKPAIAFFSEKSSVLKEIFGDESFKSGKDKIDYYWKNHNQKEYSLVRSTEKNSDQWKRWIPDDKDIDLIIVNAKGKIRERAINDKNETCQEIANEMGKRKKNSLVLYDDDFIIYGGKRKKPEDVLKNILEAYKGGAE